MTRAGMDLSDLIARNAAFTPEKVALRHAGTSLTYAALARRIDAAARALKSVLGVGAATGSPFLPPTIPTTSSSSMPARASAR